MASHPLPVAPQTTDGGSPAWGAAPEPFGQASQGANHAAASKLYVQASRGPRKSATPSETLVSPAARSPLRDSERALLPVASVICRVCLRTCSTLWPWRACSLPLVTSWMSSCEFWAVWAESTARALGGPEAASPPRQLPCVCCQRLWFHRCCLELVF